MLIVRSARLSVVVAADAAALALLSGSAAELRARAAHPRAWVLEVGIDRALLVAAGAAVWLAAAWLGLGLLAALGARLPGAGGRLGAAVARRVLPRTLIGLVAGAAGVGVLLAPIAAGADPVPSPRPTVAAPTWPADPPATSTAATPAPIEAPTWPISPARATRVGPPPPTSAPTLTARPRTAPPKAAPPRTAPAAGVVRVQPGDSLWLLTGRRLGPDTPAAEIAAAWPRWYAANRPLIGADPSLIRPGQVLHAPAPATPEEIR